MESTITMNVVLNNLLKNIPGDMPQELFQPLLEGRAFRLERIVSDGHQSAANFWSDQPCDEWVVLLTGSATISFADQGQAIDLAPFDYLHIPSGCRHRVSRTSSEEKTVWLALHFDSAVES